VDLREGLLQQRHPHLLPALTTTERQRAVGEVHREPVVQYRVVPVVALGQPHDVDAVLQTLVKRQVVVEHLVQQV
jgi:hypothetical protein